MRCIGCIEVSTPLKNTPPFFFAKAPLKSTNCPSFLFLGNFGDLVSEWHTLKECISLASQIVSPLTSQPRRHCLTTGNASAANGALTIGQVCAALQKYVCSCWRMYNRLYRHFVECVRNSIIWWDGVSGKKNPVFLDCYRLAIGRESSRKTLL